MEVHRALTAARYLRYQQQCLLLSLRRLSRSSKYSTVQQEPSPSQVPPPKTEWRDSTDKTYHKGSPDKAYSQGMLTVQPQTLHLYTESTPPTKSQLKYADKFFGKHAPPLLWSCAEFVHIPRSTLPEICFLGRSNVGKSSLLNALLLRPVSKPAHVSARRGRTRTMNAFGVQGHEAPRSDKSQKDTGLIVVDMPGYGAGSQERWGTEILKYIRGRTQLRKTFVLVDAEHGLKRSDEWLLRHLAEDGIPHQIILSKIDKVLRPGSKGRALQRISNGLLQLQDVCEDIRAVLRSSTRNDVLGDILCCSAELEGYRVGAIRPGKLGIDAVRWAALSACGLACDENGQGPSMPDLEAA